MNNLYVAIKALLTLLNTGIYSQDVIFQAYQNNYVLPKNSQYIIMTQFDKISVPLSPMYAYDPINEIDNYATIDSVPFQVDFYGSPASNQASQFRLVLQTIYGAEFLSTYGVSIYKVQNERNLTNNLDRDMYLQRYVVRFSLLSDNVFTPSSLGFIPADVNNLYLTEVQT